MAKKISKLVLAIISCDTRQTLERWQFDVHVVKDNETEETSRETVKPRSEVNAEIQAIIRQITASVTFLPLLEDKCKLFKNDRVRSVLKGENGLFL